MADRSTSRYYRRARFVTHLPADCLYTASHFWLRPDQDGIWTVGFTRFATRMLGDIVEIVFTVAPGDEIALGQGIGSVEGFKAVSDVFSVVTGVFVSHNEALDRDITRIEHEPYGEGWLFKAAGVPDPQHGDAEAYAAILDTTIDAMLASRHEPGGAENG